MLNENFIAVSATKSLFTSFCKLLGDLPPPDFFQKIAFKITQFISFFETPVQLLP